MICSNPQCFVRKDTVFSPHDLAFLLIKGKKNYKVKFSTIFFKNRQQLNPKPFFKIIQPCAKTQAPTAPCGAGATGSTKTNPSTTWRSGQHMGQARAGSFQAPLGARVSRARQAAQMLSGARQGRQSATWRQGSLKATQRNGSQTSGFLFSLLL